MPRGLKILLIGAGVVVFLVISGLLARFLAVENVERQDVIALLQAEAAGNASRMLAQLVDCPAPCQAVVRSDAAKLRGPGAVKILAYQSATSHTIGRRTGQARVAWKLGDRLPDVQCVTVRRTGDPVSGITVALLKIGPPIPLTNDC